MSGAQSFRIGTRGSRLALAQTTLVSEALRRLHPQLAVETVILQTTGDKILDSSLSRIGGKGVFTREIEEALLDGRIDVAVHSLKDLPVRQPEGLALGAITEREPAHDILIAREPLDWKQLGPDDTLGTSSLRRQAQVRARNRRVQIADIRGNVPTRIRKMIEGQYTAILLAAAGVRRLALEAPFIAPILFEDILPAPGQGSIGLQVRAGDERALRLIAGLHHAASAACCTAERALLEALGGGCQLPLGTLGEMAGDGRLRLRGRVVSLDGARVIEDEESGDADDSEAIGRRLGEKLLAAGAREILAAIVAESPDDGFEQAVARAEAMNALPLGGRTVLLTRDEDADGPLSMALRAQGANPLCLPLVRHMAVEDDSALRRAAQGAFDWLVLTSARGVDALAGALGGSLAGIAAPVACVGQGTARRLEERGGRPALVPEEGTAAGLLRAFEQRGGLAGKRVLYPRADKAKPTLADGLHAMGAAVEETIAYRTVATAGAAEVMNELRSGRVDAVLFTSASAAEALGEAGDAAVFRSVAVGAMGPTTASALRAAGIEPDFEPAERTFEGLVEALARHLAVTAGPGGQRSH